MWRKSSHSGKTFFRRIFFQPDLLCRGSYSITFLWKGGTKINNNSLGTIPKDMGEEILNTDPHHKKKKRVGWVKNISSTRDLVEKLFIAAIANNVGLEEKGGAPKSRCYFSIPLYRLCSWFWRVLLYLVKEGCVEMAGVMLREVTMAMLPNIKVQFPGDGWKYRKWVVRTSWKLKGFIQIWK